MRLHRDMLTMGIALAVGGAMSGWGVAAASADMVSSYHANITQLNNSGASGDAWLTVDQNKAAKTASIHVKVHAIGLQDLTAFGGVHLAHIHGQFKENVGQPISKQTTGPFFSGNGGQAVDSVLPTQSADGGTVKDGIVDFFEALPAYGPVVQNLTAVQLPSPPSGTSPMESLISKVKAGADPASLFPSGTQFNLDTTYHYDLTNADQARQFNNISPLNLREIVIHGGTVKLSVSNAIDAAVGTPAGSILHGVDLGNGQAFRIALPVAAGEFQKVGVSTVPLPASVWMGLAMLGIVGLMRWRIKRASRA